MEGVARAAKRKFDAEISLAWHTAAFTGATQSKRGLKPLSDYLNRGDQNKPQSGREMLGTLRMLQDMGAPMDIRKMN